MRVLKYSEAIAEATVQCMAADPSILLAGQCVDDAKGIYGTTVSAARRFGPARVIDIPNCETAFAGMAVGAASRGLRPLVTYTRDDFMFLAMDGIFNLAAKWRYMYGGRSGVPVVMRGVVGHGWGQGATHSQSLHTVFGHFPGLRVATPASPADAKGLLVSALRGDNPVVLIENRGLYESVGEVPEELYEVPFGKGRIVRAGDDVTIVAVSLMVREAERAAMALAEQGVSAEVVDLRSIRPLDEEIVLTSVAKTGRLVIADTTWARYGVGAEVAAVVAEQMPSALRAPVRRIAPPDCPAPVSWPLEEAYNPDATDIAQACLAVLRSGQDILVKQDELARDFVGPY
ncbi:pyruvate dehydrogenase E1 component beta subunit [Kibdelosporangium banguiense]|uniref:Pyruvate dehydrogenase E1 component beta subunit n=1 Tax=Kibdelosporangium banguiense TaxID=1365924 RepID=A0ABS4TXD1_9PSEU|nr:transketolase C-terminal domain-containing protein [Kibdelosporangium banguiense]MBP2328658.1 pyruvate dehydrogenase E1 component beta subunit [Kibdelosporangium banguiense]